MENYSQTTQFQNDEYTSFDELEKVRDVRKWSVIACICYWLVFTSFLGFIFQIILTIKASKIDPKTNFILALIGIFLIGCILDIVIAIKTKHQLKHMESKNI